MFGFGYHSSIWSSYRKNNKRFEYRWLNFVHKDGADIEIRTRKKELTIRKQLVGIVSRLCTVIIFV